MTLARLGDICWYTQGCAWRRGRILAWSIDSEMNGDASANFPVAIIEYSELSDVRSVSVTRVTFAEKPPGEKRP